MHNIRYYIYVANRQNFAGTEDCRSSSIPGRHSPGGYVGIGDDDPLITVVVGLTRRR